MDYKTKGALVCLPFLFLFLVVPHWVGGSPDYFEHQMMAEERYNGERINQPQYAPLLPTILGIFSVKDKYFDFAAMFLILVVTPMLIVLITRSWLGAFFYFTTSSYLFFMTAGLFAQALLIIFILGLFLSKNIFVRLALVVLGAISHSYGPPVMIGVLFIVLVNEYKLWTKFGEIRNLFPAAFCSPIWGTSIPETFGKKIGQAGEGTESMSVNDALSFVTKMAPFPFLFFSVKGFWDRKEFDYLFLFFGSIILAYFVNVRILLFTSVVFIIGFTKVFPNLQHKKLWMLLALANGILLFVQHHILTNKIFCP